MDQELQHFLQRDETYQPEEWKYLWPFRAIREALGLPLDNVRYRAFLSPGRTRGNFGFTGSLHRDAALQCQQCGNTVLFVGSCLTEHERVMYREIMDEDHESNYYVEMSHFCVCLRCEHMETRSQAFGS